MKNFQIDSSPDGVALVTFDVPGRTMNTLTGAVIAELAGLVAAIVADPAIKGAVFNSGKPSGFCAGADLAELDQVAAQPSDASLSAVFRSIENSGKPFAIALEGLALGGGLELALACHYRVASSAPKVKLGLPEAKVGLLPGAGGTQRLPRLIGAAAALPLILEGNFVDAAKAHELGFIDAVVEPGATLDAARAWILDVGDPVARWDKKGFRVPVGGPYAAGGQTFIMANATLRAKTHGNYPAQDNILRAVYEGLQVPIDAALRIEARYFANTRASPQARAMIRSLFLSMQELGKGARRPAGVVRSDVTTVGVLGAGMMGAGIAFAQAAVGIRTLLIDTSIEAAARGKDHVAGIVAKSVGRGHMSQRQADDLLVLVEPGTDYGALAEAQMVIEAVFEDRGVKAEAMVKAAPALTDDCVIGSNTSTLPISSLAEAVSNPERFIGVHFFSPVDRMQLVEIIIGKHTSQETLARAMDYVTKLRKTPIVVNDSRGFYTSRCFGTYVDEGLELLTEGVAPAIIDNLGRALSMPRGPLELSDDVAIDLIHKVSLAASTDLGDAHEARPHHALVAELVRQGRLGRKAGKGFYEYPPGEPKRIWRGLGELAPVRVATTDPALVAQVKARLLYRQAIEAARCFEEGVVTDPRDADVGAILGWGFSPWTGGPLSLIDSIGTAEFVRRCTELARTCGSRFEPCAMLSEMARNGGGFYRSTLQMIAA